MDKSNIFAPEIDFSAINEQMNVLTQAYFPTQHMWADEQFEILKRHIQEFEKSLDPEHQVGIMMTNFGQSVLIIVTEITYEDPVLMVFKGYVEGKQATLIQHINQLNFMLTAVEKEEKKPKQQIGFIANRQE